MAQRHTCIQIVERVYKLIYDSFLLTLLGGDRVLRRVGDTALFGIMILQGLLDCCKKKCIPLHSLKQTLNSIFPFMKCA
jgi:hypothetical protein